MRKNILSIVIAAFSMLVVLGISSITKKDSGGVAIAAPYDEARRGTEYTQKSLRKSVAYHPENFLQLSGLDVRAVLKEPDFVRQDFPTVVWQYRTSSCVLDIYFSSDVADVSDAPIIHYEVRARETDISDEDINPACVRHVVRSRNGLRMVDVSAIYKRP